MSKNPKEETREVYKPAPGFWQPRVRGGRKPLRDTAETMLEMQEFQPAKVRPVNLATLSPNQSMRESAFQLGRAARTAGKKRDSTNWHKLAPQHRSTLDIDGLAAFELGWDTENAKIEEAASARQFRPEAPEAA